MVFPPEYDIFVELSGNSIMESKHHSRRKPPSLNNAMDYKKFIQNRQLRLKLLRMMCLIPDTLMLKMQYRIKFGRSLNLKNPQRFTEKLQWYKLHYHDSEMIRCVDKYEVRGYLAERGFMDLLVKSYGVYDSPEEINWNTLPNSFVIKDTLGGGGTAVQIVRNAEKLNREQMQLQLQQWCDTPICRDGGREWPYYSGKRHRILIEEYLDAPGGLDDFKFFCFYGKPEFLYVVSDRTLGDGGKIHILNPDYTDTGTIRVGDEPDGDIPPKPSCYAEMIEIAKALSKPFPHVRVDLYAYQGKVKFGELTFYNASGYMSYQPDSFDIEIGKKFVLPPEQSLK